MFHNNSFVKNSSVTNNFLLIFQKTTNFRRSHRGICACAAKYKIKTKDGILFEKALNSELQRKRNLA